VRIQNRLACLKSSFTEFSLMEWVVLWVADPSIDPSLGMIEVVQEVGETIYVPQGWWHCVLNLGLTVAATENVMLKEMLSEPFVETLRTLSPEHTDAWLHQLNVHRPELVTLVGGGAHAGSEGRDDDGGQEQEGTEGNTDKSSDTSSQLVANENGVAALGIDAQCEGAPQSAVDEI
jgi:hypothetical protein